MSDICHLEYYWQNFVIQSQIKYKHSLNLQLLVVRTKIREINSEDHKNSIMGTTVEEKRADCTPCRLVGSLGLVGIGAYLANAAFKNKTVAGKVVVSSISFVFVTLGVQRYKQQFPFNKNVQKS